MKAATAEKPKAREFETREERDQFLEAQYGDYDRKGYPNTLAYVGGELDELVRQFHATYEGVEDARPALLRFEVEVFGAPLETVAHGMLWSAIKRTLRNGPPEERRIKVPPRKDGEASLDFIERICRHNGLRVVPASDLLRSMPRPAPSDWSVAPAGEP